ncbi:MAG: DinB family protein [Gemmatimonadetes bacterium]|nr:DinB family protein [Gemmatimonadota bacterium]
MRCLADRTVYCPAWPFPGERPWRSETALLSPGDGRFSPGDLGRHIAATERWMWGENVLGLPSRYPGHGSDLAEGRPAVLEYLDSMQDATARIVAGLSSDQLESKVATVGGVEMRVWEWLRLMIEHQIHHRGQLYAVLGEMGVETPPLYGLTEPEVKARSSI